MAHLASLPPDTHPYVGNPEFVGQMWANNQTLDHVDNPGTPHDSEIYRLLSQRYSSIWSGESIERTWGSSNETATQASAVTDYPVLTYNPDPQLAERNITVDSVLAQRLASGNQYSSPTNGTGNIEEAADDDMPALEEQEE